jgi:hypothetical protein
MRHKTLIITALIGGSAIAGCASGTKVNSAAGELAPATPPNRFFIPAGTVTMARFNQSISTNNRDGDEFTATVTQPVYAQDGSVAIPVGAMFRGVVTGVHAAKVPGERNVIRLNIDALRMNGRTYPFMANISDVRVENSTGASKRTIRNTAIGAAAGAALGAVLTGADASGIITGGLLGAGAGAVISLGQGNNTPATIPAGSAVTIQATQGVAVR